MPFVRDARTTLVIVDMVVDSVTGFWPVHNPEETIANVGRVREACYAAGTPVVQLQHTNRPDGLTAVLNEARLEDGVTPAACVPGTPGWEIVPELDAGDRDIVVPKSRWHGFFGSELLTVLRSLGTEQILWTGVFTDACLSLSVFEGYFHDYPGALVADAASCTNDFIHKTSVLNMANWVYDLTIFTTPNIERWLAGEDAPSWYSGRHNTVPYASADDVERMYESIVSPAGIPVATSGD
ncbi:MAG: hypothetical protein QOH74_321 [Gaiellales bacterium]|jgi:nicotinamidase-related amidase|nr:hypothetical protein [Gaiellales bacterium]